MDIAFITKLRQSIASFTVLALLSTFVGTAAFAEGEWPFTDDEPADAEVAAAAMAAYDAGYMTGTGEGAFDAEGIFNRAQAAKVVVLAYLGEDQVMEASEAPFDDVQLGEWYTDYVYTAQDFGLVEGRTATTYEPARTLNDAETVTLVFRAMGVTADTTGEPSFTDTDSGDWWYEAVATLYNWSVVEMAEFDPSEATTRGEVAVQVDRSMDPEYRAEEPVEGDDDDEPVSEDGSVLMVELSDDTPAADTIPSQASSVPVATWDFTASGGDVNIERLIVKKGGVSSLSSSSLTIWMGNTRLSSEASINSSTDLATFNNLDVEVEEGETVALTARLNLQDMTASSEASFELESVNAVDAGAAEVQGDFPLTGELFALSTVDVGTVTITKNGTITNPSVGENDAIIAQFKAAAGTNPGLVQQFNLYLDGGSINSDAIENLELYVVGEDEPIATVDGVDANGLASFVLDQEFSEDADEEFCEGKTGYCIADGGSNIFKVRADLNTGRASDTIKAYFDETFDVIVEDARRGFNMTVDLATSGTYDGSSCTSSSGNCSFSTVQGGDITISTDTVTDRNVAVDEEDVTVMNFTVTAEADATFKNFIVGLDTSADTADATAGLLADGSTANFTDIKVRSLDGSFTYGPVDVTAFSVDTAGSPTTDFDDVDTVLSSAGDSYDTIVAYYSFSDDLALDAGDSMDFEMTLDVANQSALANMTFTPYVYIDATNPEIKDSNNNTVTNTDSVAPSSRISGDEFTVKSNSLALSADTGVGSQTVVIGADDVEFVGFSVTAGDAEDIEITSLTLTGYIDIDSSGPLNEGAETTNFSEVVQSVNLYEGSVSEENQINSSAKSPVVSTGKVVFDDISWTIPAGETRTLIATGDVDRNSSWDDYRLKMDIEDASEDIEASDEDGDTVTATGDVQNGSTAGAGTTGTSSVSSGAMITVQDGGTLSADVASGTPQSEIVVATSTGNEFAELRFTATYESYQITDLALRNDFSATAGDYDDNISELSIRYYTDEAQTEEATTTCALTSSSLFACSIPSASPIYVPDSELSGVVDYASVFVEADINDVTSALADEGDKPAFTITLADDFEATGVDSGKKVEESGTNDLFFADIASLTLTDTTVAVSTDFDEDDTTIAGTSLEDSVAVGDFICVDVDSNTACDSDLMYVTARGTNQVTVVRGVGSDSASSAGTDVTIAGGNDYVMVYGTPDTTDEVMTTNYMQVQATDLDVVADASTQTGSPDTAEIIMDLTVTANSAKDAKIRKGLLEAVATDPTEVFAAAADADAATSTSTSVDGTALIWTADKDTVGADDIAANDGFLYAASGEGVLDNYAYVSYWVWFQDTSGSTGLNDGDLHFVIDDDSTSLANGDEDVFSTGAIADETWTFVTTTLSSIDVADDFFGLRATDITRVADTDEIGLDRVVFYNDKFNVDLTLNENWGSTTPSLAYLQRTDAGGGSQTVTTYAYLTNPSGTTGAAQLLFVPTTAELTIDGADDFKVKFDTTAITENSDATESLTATIEFGNVSTNGDVFWYDQASQVTFFGVESTDRASVVTRY